jgi:hypothetical protein
MRTRAIVAALRVHGMPDGDASTVERDDGRTITRKERRCD